MKTVILCGGQGTRIRDVSDQIPKPLVPVGPLPILWHIMRYYAHFDHKDFVLCLGYKGKLIKDFFLNYDTEVSDFTIQLGAKKSVEFLRSHGQVDWRVTLAETGQSTMTGGRIARIEPYIGDDELFMVTYGDGVGTIDLKALEAFHRGHGKVLTVTGVRPPGRFGELEANAEGQVTEFNEKPQSSGGRISGGFFVADKRLFQYLKPIEGQTADDVVFETHPMRQLAKDGQLMVYPHDGFWQPMDTARDYNYLNGLYQRSEAPWMVW